MATLDPETGGLVLQIAYDGAPLSGKTASILALGRLLGREVFTPEEHEGRTLFFDWLDYRGGVCLGRPIRCQVIAVPGQPPLAHRREAILAKVDGVIFVADSTAGRFDLSCEHVARLKRQLSRRGEEVPVLLQLNKRDESDSLTRDTMLERLGAEYFRRDVETVATEDDGIREAFVFAVSEVVRELKKSGAIYRDLTQQSKERLAEPETADELLRALEALEHGHRGSEAHRETADSAVL